LSVAEAYEAMSAILDGKAGDAQIAALLVALRMKGETAFELAGFARAMRKHMIVVDAGDDVIDTAGTGGDSCGTFNVSTAAALIMAGAGARVAKHGNRSISSACGSADVLEALGIRIELSPEEAVHSIREIGIGFLFAPNLHPAMRHAQPVRRALKLRTAFNFLGPLSNPARARMQIIGAPSPEAARLMAEALTQLGTTRSFIVHGYDGLDEVTTTAPTDVFEVTSSGIDHHLWTPADFGVPKAALSDLSGGDAERNAQIIKEILSGTPGPRRDIAMVNAAAGLLAAGIAPSLWECVDYASRSIDSGAALKKLELLQKKFAKV
jgi:anthranilate phosphoribosyltransferase